MRTVGSKLNIKSSLTYESEHERVRERYMSFFRYVRKVVFYEEVVLLNCGDKFEKDFYRTW